MLNLGLGKAGEIVAVKFLLAHGFKILTQNFRCQVGEIDIVATKENTLYFIEVKTRTSAIFGWPAESVTLKKQSKLQKLALYYVVKTNYSGPLSFGVVEVLLNQFTGHYQVNFIPNAF